jgi:phage shock protein PspC (stress-responsive transcriptional regulator)
MLIYLISDGNELFPEEKQCTSVCMLKQVPMAEEKRLTRSKTNRLLGGVCGGIAEYFGWDSSLVRLGWAVATLFTSGGGILVYILALIIIPEEDGDKKSDLYTGE